MFLSHFSSGHPHSGAQLSRIHLTREYGHKKRDQPPICFGKELFRFRPESISGARFSNARPGAGLRHEPVALKTGKVCSHRVIGEVQFVASSFTVHSPARKRSRILPRVLLNNRSRQPICLIKPNHGREKKVKRMFD